MLPINQSYVDIVVEYRPIMRLMHDFSQAMRSTSRKETPFNNGELKRLLHETNFFAAEAI